MYKFKARKNFFDQNISDFGELLDHVEAETARLTNAGRTGYVEIVDTESGAIVALTLPYLGDVVAYLEGEFDMVEISETDRTEAQPEETENLTGWEQFTEDVMPEPEPVAEAPEPEEKSPQRTSDVAVETQNDVEVLPETHSNSFDVVTKSFSDKYGLLSQKLVSRYAERAERLRKQLLNQIRTKESGLIQKELDQLQKQINQKQNIYESLFENVKTTSDIDGLITIASELVELQLQYDKVAMMEA